MASELWERFKAARDFSDRTQDDIAKACKVSRGLVAQWESGKKDIRSQPKIEQVLAFSEITGVPVDWLLNDAADPIDVWQVGRVWASERRRPALQASSEVVVEPRLLVAFKHAVEFEILTREPVLAEGFNVPLGHGPVAVRADFCCPKAIVTFAMTIASAMSPETMGRLLLLESASGKRMAKVMIVNDPSPAHPEVLEYMLTTFGIKVIQVASPAEAADQIIASCY